MAAAQGIKLEVSERERLERQTIIDLIPALFVCVLPDGPLEFGGGSWLTSRKSTLSDAVVPTAKRQRPPPVGITGQVSLIAWAYACDDRSTNNEGQGGDRPNTGRGVFVLVSLLLVAPFYLGS